MVSKPHKKTIGHEAIHDMNNFRIASKTFPKAEELAFAPQSFVFPATAAVLIGASLMGSWLDATLSTLIATAVILFAGIPHGALDIEVAMKRFGKSSRRDKSVITLFYLGGAALMAVFWWMSPPVALVIFLAISVIHFGGDWNGRVDPFLAAMIGWAIISMPALFHMNEVNVLFGLLTDEQDNGAIAALLACTAVPAFLGSLVFTWLAVMRGDTHVALNVFTCLVSAIFLPPLIGFALYFCLLHSPRHMVEAFSQSGPLSPITKVMTCAAVTALSFGLGALLYNGLGASATEGGVVRAGFMLLSILTVPHFALELMMDAKNANREAAH
jgi:beta-carotene 15,15'-dioxygenase